MATTRTTIAENIKRLRQLRGWTQDELAREAGVSSVSMIESGERKNPRKKTIEAIALALGVPVAELYREHALTPSPVLEEFLRTVGQDATDEERGLLLWMSIPGRKHTVRSYYLLLMTIRETAKLP